MENMCSTCNYKQYSPISASGELMYEKSIGNDTLIIRYVPRERSYRIFSAANPTSGFWIHHCLTCGRRLF